jgi:hypothetical protein
MVIVPETGHTSTPLQAQRISAWLFERLGVAGR